MPTRARSGAILLLTGILSLGSAVALAQAPAASALPTDAPSASASVAPVPSADPCAVPIASAGPGASAAPGASPAAPDASAADPGASPAAPASPDPEATAPASAAPTLDPCATPLPSAEPTARPSRGPTGPVPEVRPVALSLKKVAEGFENPNGLFHAGDDRLFVGEQLGYIVVLKRNDDGTFRDGGMFLDIRDRVECCGEKGLLGVAFPPDYAQTGRFYVTYAGSGHSWFLDERRVSADDPDRADPEWRRNLIRIYKPRDFHWGGNMAFGPDGYLWVGMGDGGFAGQAGDPGDPDNRAQDLSQLWGKFLRIDPNDPDGRSGPARYAIPPDNPYVERRGAAPEVWLRGVRNPWRWSFDRVTGDLWITDVGMHTWEEVDRLRAPDPGKGANLGWRLMEGPECYDPPTGCERGADDLTMPIAAYRHEVAEGGYRCAITGGYVYRGERSPAMRSWYLYADYCSGTIFQLDSAGPRRQPVEVALDTDLAISAMGEDADGELYVLDYTLDKATAIYRIDGRPRR
jgi:glucose/arabinose dehydrogenase